MSYRDNVVVKKSTIGMTLVGLVAIAALFIGLWAGGVFEKKENADTTDSAAAAITEVVEDVNL